MSRTVEFRSKKGSGRLFYGLGREEMVPLVGKGGADGNPRTGRNLRRGVCDTICRPFRAWEQGSWIDVVELDGRTFGGVLGLRDGQTPSWQRKTMTSGTVSKVPFGRQRHVVIVLTAGTVSYFHICRYH